MDSFRTFSENRSFIIIGLLILLMNVLSPACHAGMVSFAADDGQSQPHSANGDTHHDDALHGEPLSHHCCIDLTVQVDHLPDILPSSTISVSGLLDIEAVPLNIYFANFISYPTDLALNSTDFSFKTSGLPLYLVTHRLRV